MATRTIAPLRSLRSVVSRQAAPRVVAGRFAGRFYSTEAEAAEVKESPELVEAKKRAAELEDKVKSLEKDVLYHKADIQTLNRRVADERQKASEFAISSFARSLLSTPDILTTALKHVPKPIESGSALASLANGVEMTQKAMLKTFQEAGVVKMEVARGSAFDPNLHEATFQIPKEIAPPKEGGAEWGPGEVVEVAKEGWMIGSRVLRPAQVGVTQIE